MSALASLVRAYERMAVRNEVPAFGYSTEKIGFVISLNADGTLAGVPSDLRSTEGRNRRNQAALERPRSENSVQSRRPTPRHIRL